MIVLNPNAQLIAWVFALVNLVLGAYIFLMNRWSRTNQLMSALLLVFAIYSFGVGLAYGALTYDDVLPTFYISAALAPITAPLIFLSAMELVKAGYWQRNKSWRWFQGLMYASLLTPPFLVLLDVIVLAPLSASSNPLSTGSQFAIYFQNIPAIRYHGGFIPIDNILTPFGQFLSNLFLYGISSLTFIPLLHTAIFDRRAHPKDVQLAWILIIAQSFNLFALIVLSWLLLPGMNMVFANGVFGVAYSYVAFRQILPQRATHPTRLQTHLTSIVLSIILPMMIATVAMLTAGATTLLEQRSTTQMQSINQTLKTRAGYWVSTYVKGLNALVREPAIIQRDIEDGKAVLQDYTINYSGAYLISTTDENGMNIMRSDGADLLDYSDRQWFQSAMNSTDEVVFQTVIGRTSGKPALVMARAIRDAEGNVTGVGMFSVSLETLANYIQTRQVGLSGFGYLVDEYNYLLAGPQELLTDELKDMSAEPPVKALRSGQIGIVEFSAADGTLWYSYIDRTAEGFGMVVQMTQAEIWGGIEQINQFALTVILIGAFLALLLVWLAVRQNLKPIETLTATAAAITGGQINRTAPVESQDELGLLAQSFNSMTSRLRQTLAGLENQVKDRTRELEDRSTYLQTSVEVSRAIATILDPDDLVKNVVVRIQEGFGLYYVGLFQVDSSGQWAILRAGTGAAGQAMLQRGHRIAVGSGMVGWCIANNMPRIALQASADTVRMVTPDLPNTRSEAALPLRSRGQVLGALTIQSERANAFNDDNLAILQVMADQVGVALDNARLFAESQQALAAIQSTYEQSSRQAWAEMIHTRTDVAFVSNELGTTRAQAWYPEMQSAMDTGVTMQGESAGDGQPIAIPIKVRGIPVGVIHTRKPNEAGLWAAEEVAMLENVTDQLGVALENARLYRETQQSAARDRLVSSITDRMRRSLDIESLLQTAIQEIAGALGVDEAFVQLIPPDLIPETQRGDASGNHHPPGADNGKEGTAPAASTASTPGVDQTEHPNE